MTNETGRWIAAATGLLFACCSARPAAADVRRIADPLSTQLPSIADGRGPGGPILLAKRRRKRRKKKSDTYSWSSSSEERTVHIDPNTATLEELEVLPLVDTATAKAIIEHRPYRKPEDLIKVPGVGHLKYSIFKKLIVIREAPPAAE